MKLNNSNVNPAGNFSNVAHKRRFSWGKFFYFALISVLLFLFIYWAINRMFFIKGFGIFTAHNTQISVVVGARVQRLTAHLNQPVEAGDTLMVLTDLRQIDVNQGISLVNFDRKKNKDMLDLLEKVDLATNKYNSAVKDAQQSQNAYEEGRKMQAAGIITATRLEELRQNAQEARYRMDAGSIELRYARDRLAAWRKGGNPEVASFNNAVDSSPDMLLAPHHGMVTSIETKPYEVATPGDRLMTITDYRYSYVLAYFDLGNEYDIFPGQGAFVRFRNGDSYRGQIRRIYPLTQPLSSEYQKQYGPREKYILAEVFLTPKTFFTPEMFDALAQKAMVSTVDINSALQQAGYLDQEGRLQALYEPQKDPNLTHLDAKYRMLAPDIVAIIDHALELEFGQRMIDMKANVYLRHSPFGHSGGFSAWELNPEVK